MSADEGNAAQPADGEDKSPEEIREEIERTREALGDTVEALAEKTDVKAQATARVEQAKESIREARDEFVSGARERAGGIASTVREATPESAGAGAQQVTQTVQEKPLPFATAGAFAAGVLIGWLLGRRS